MCIVNFLKENTIVWSFIPKFWNSPMCKKKEDSFPNEMDNWEKK